MDFQLELIATGTAAAAAFLVFRCLRRYDHRGNGPKAFTFVADNDDSAEEKPYCAVCLNDIAGGESCRKLTECSHCFHVDCVDAWLQTHSTCPLCRTQVSDHIFWRECGGGILDLLVSWSENILDKICCPLNQELSSMVCENMMYVRQL